MVKKTRRIKFKKLVLIFLVCVILGLVGVGIGIAVIIHTLPDPAKISEQEVIESTKIFDRTKTHILYDIHGEEKRTVIPFNEIPDSIKHATVAIEDSGFYSHSGFDFRGILRALWVDLKTGSLSQGGSTITQQLIKKSYLSDEKKISRKVKEIILAIWLDSRYPKDQILELYLNKIPYGSNAYGIEAASKTFFGKSAKNLTLAESALLASVPRATTYYSPYGNHKDELLQRKNVILDRMQELGYITTKERDGAKDEKLVFLNPKQDIHAPHLVMMVKEYLINKYGEEAVDSGGLEVTTTIDAGLQEEAERIVKEGVEKNKALIGAHNGALVAINPKTGDIISLVGSYDYFDTEHDGNFNVATALRQPGSSFKPFIYATALKKGYTPDTILMDVPTEFDPRCPAIVSTSTSIIKVSGLCYHPQNYDETFRGPVKLRQAIAQSLNVPSVELLYLAGVEDSIKTAEDLGISTLTNARACGLALVLGCAEVRLIEMTNAYGVFANDGVLNKSRYILKVEKRGVVLEEKTDAPKTVIDTFVARTMNSLLSDNNARIPVYRPNSSLFFPDRPVAAKTGTTQEYHDAWTIGYTPSLVVGMWVGNNDNKPIQQEGSGVMAAAPIWRSFMDTALKTTLPEEFPRPDTVQTPQKPIFAGLWEGDTIVKIDTASNKLATSLTPQDFIKEIAVGQPHSILYWVDRNDPTGPPPANPGNDPQFNNWEIAFQNWFTGSGRVIISPDVLPKTYDDVHTEKNKPIISLISFKDTGTSYSLEIRIFSPFQLKEVDVFKNDEIIKTLSFPPSGTIVILINKEEGEGGMPDVKITAYDTQGNHSEVILPDPEPPFIPTMSQ